jgi:hypothetical protein
MAKPMCRVLKKRINAAGHNACVSFDGELPSFADKNATRHIGGLYTQRYNRLKKRWPFILRTIPSDID